MKPCRYDDEGLGLLLGAEERRRPMARAPTFGPCALIERARRFRAVCPCALTGAVDVPVRPG